MRKYLIKNVALDSNYHLFSFIVKKQTYRFFKSIFNRFLLSISLFVSVNSYALTFTMPSTDDDGSFEISWSGVRVYINIDEKIDGVWTTINGAGGNGSYQLTRPNGSYTFRLKDCTSGDPSTSCIILPEKTITITIASPLNTNTFSITSLPSQTVALTQGDLSIEQGQSFYKIPLELPPAINDFKPDLYLDNGNPKVLGLSKIERCTGSDFLKNNYGNTTSFQQSRRNSNRLCLNGVYLINNEYGVDADSVDYWRDGSTYRTEDSNGSIVTINETFHYETPTSGYTLRDFTEKRIDGSTYYYGGTTKHAHGIDDLSDGIKYFWVLKKAVDKYANQYFVVYDFDDEEERPFVHPSAISYSPNSRIDFEKTVNGYSYTTSIKGQLLHQYNITENMQEGNTSNQALRQRTIEKCEKITNSCALPLTLTYNSEFDKRYELEGILDGFGNSTTVTRDELNSSNYSVGQTPPSGMSSLSTTGVRVVEMVTVVGANSLSNSTSYSYKNGYKSNTSDSFVGYGQITRSDSNTRTILQYDYEHLSPKVSNILVESVLGDKIREIENTYTFHPDNEQLAYLEQSIASDYQLQNSPVSVVSSNYQRDKCGTLTSETKYTALTKYNIETNYLHKTSINNTNLTYSAGDCVTEYVTGFIGTISTTTQNASGTDIRLVTTTFEPESSTNNDIKKVNHHVNGEAHLALSVVYTRNSSGMITGTQKSGKDYDGSNLYDRFSEAVSYNQNSFISTLRNPVSHYVSYGFNARTNQINSVNDASGLTTTTSSDYFGHMLTQTTDEGNTTSYHRFLCSASGPFSCPSNTIYGIATQIKNYNAAIDTEGAPLTVNFYNSQHLLIQAWQYQAVNDSFIKVRREYDNLGRLLSISQPVSASASYSPDFIDAVTYSNFNGLDEPLTITQADGGSVNISYSVANNIGLLQTRVMKVFSSPSQYTTQMKLYFKNALGQLHKVTEHNGGNVLAKQIFYTYDSLGHLASTTIAVGQSNFGDSNTTVTQRFDNAGNMLALTDPASGQIEFEYNAFGEVRIQRWLNAAGTEAKRIEYQYDKLGRKIKRIDTDANNSANNHLFTWNWDMNGAGSGRKFGRLYSQSGNGITETYQYDNYARLATHTTSFDNGNGNKVFNYTYDDYGRLNTLTYPNGLKIKRGYYNAGGLAKTWDQTTSQSQLIWENGQQVNDFGVLTQTHWGNGLTTEKSFSNTGNLTGITTGLLDSSDNLTGNIQKLNYQFDSVGNLLSRTSAQTNNQNTAIENYQESFIYDEFNRLKSSTVNNNSPLSPFGYSSGTTTKNYQYDSYNNLSINNTVQYNQTYNASIYGVTRANGLNYHYDDYGNVVKRGSTNITYDVFNKPTQIGNTTFRYGADHKRYKQVIGNKTTYYINNGLYEEVIEGTTTTTKSLVDGVFIWQKQNNQVSKTYLHKDHLGSIEAMSDENGQLIGRFNFDAWGKPVATSQTPNNAITSLGFTGHEMLETHGLIHMNGRVYDPSIGRFLSADILVQAPTITQNYNRYGYVFNNPLSLVDPSGYEAGSGPEYDSQSKLVVWASGLTGNYVWDASKDHFDKDGNFVHANCGKCQLEADRQRIWIPQLFGNMMMLQNVVEGRRRDGDSAQKRVLNDSGDAVFHYYNGNGVTAALSDAVKQKIMNHSNVKDQVNKNINGTGTPPNRIDIDFTSDGWDVFHLGDTKVIYTETCSGGSCTTTFTAPIYDRSGVADRFEDPLSLGFELLHGVPYNYETFDWSVTYPKP